MILLSDKDNYHYIGVTNLNRLMNLRNTEVSDVRIQCIWCERCLNGFRCNVAFEKHSKLCERNQIGTTMYLMPTNNRLEFTDWSKTVTPPFVIYADFESILPKDAVYSQRHLPISAGLLLINNFTGETTYKKFVGTNCVYQFLKSVADIAKDVVLPYYKHETNKSITMTSEDLRTFNASTNCYLCLEKDDKLVRDHDHFTGLNFYI